MLTLTQNYRTINQAISKQPVYVLEIIFARGGSGTDGINDIYFSTCAVTDILNFPYTARWFPFLRADSISGISQTVDPINGVSTIGTLSAALTDHGGMVSAIIKAADDAGHGLRRQRVEVYKLFKGMDWADRVRIRTLQVQDLKLSQLNEYTITAADIQAQLRNTVFNPSSTVTTGTVAASGAATIPVTDTRNFKTCISVNYGTKGFIKIDSEIMYWDTSTTTSFNVPALGRALFGTVAAAHALNATVSEIIYLNENPITMALKIIESSGAALSNGAYDAYPAAWGCNLTKIEDVDEEGWLLIGELLTGLSPSHLPGDGLQFEFVLNKGVEAKKFIEDSILKIIGAYGFVRGDGTYSIRAYNDLANAAKENAVAWLSVNNVIKWGDLSYNYQDLANELWIDYDEEPKLSGTYIRSGLFFDAASQKKWGVAKLLKYVVQGIPATSVFINQLYQRFQRVMARYSRPPMGFQLTVLPMMHTLEIGDIVRVTLPVRDLVTGQSIDRAFEVKSIAEQTKTGEISLDLIAQPEQASFWSGGVGVVASVTISPGNVSIQNGGTQQLIARCFDGVGNQIQTPAIAWYAAGNITISSTGLVTATGVGSGTAYAIVGSVQSNIASIFTTASANTNAVVSIAVSPSIAMLAAAQIQAITAQAFDIFGNQVNGVNFTWASSAPGIATIPAGPSASATITAVANGTTNITATSAGITSAACQVAVANAVIPTYTPPSIADAAYKIGTQITSLGPIGGPHTIPDGYIFNAGDYWFDGDVNIPINNTCHINLNVRLFSLGVVTIAGMVDGKGRGGDGGSIYRATWEIGFVGKGGDAGDAATMGPLGYALGTQYATAPVITINGTAVNGSGQITALSGLPNYTYGANLGLAGSGGGEGRFWGFGLSTPTIYLTPGAQGGSGLLIMARGIYLTSGTIDLRGADGAAINYGTPAPPYTNITMGGGGGGSFVALAQANSLGLPVMSINIPRVLVTGGAGGTSIGNPSGFAGTPGCIITQVIG